MSCAIACSVASCRGEQPATRCVVGRAACGVRVPPSVRAASLVASAKRRKNRNGGGFGDLMVRVGRHGCPVQRTAPCYSNRLTPRRHLGDLSASLSSDRVSRTTGPSPSTPCVYPSSHTGVRSVSTSITRAPPFLVQTRELHMASRWCKATARPHHNRSDCLNAAGGPHAREEGFVPW